MNSSEIFERLQQQFGDAIVHGETTAIDPWVQVEASKLVEICTFLRDEPDLQFNFCNCITAVDYLQTDPKKLAKTEWEPHLEVVYHLSSITKKHTLVLKVMTSRWKDDQLGQLPEVPSVAGLWQTADWHEREVYDLSGVCFTGHPDLRRILCPDDWAGYPLRKDYEMPTEYHGIRGG